MNRDIAEMSLGLGGSTFVNDTAKTYGPFHTIIAMTDTIFSQIDPVPSGNTFTNTTVSKGLAIYGAIKSFTLTSGSVMAYKSI